MNPDERWQQLERLFIEASELALADRGFFLSNHCAGDQSMRDELVAMLASDDAGSGTFVGRIVRHEVAHATAPVKHEGQRIGPYRVLGNLGSGGMGAVYLAVRDDDHFSKEVAIKMLRTGLANEGAQARFRAERQILAGLEHPNIARLLDGGATEVGDPYLVMEYVSGSTITDYCSSHNLSNSAKIALFRQVCEAVNYAHQKLLVHRDLKPANILVSDAGVPKLLDFGIAKLLDPTAEDTPKTMTGYLMMTPDYASPEQVRGEPVTTSTDVYALGAVLYHLLSGQKPHGLKNYDPAELTREICQTDVRPPSETGNLSLRGDLDTIVLKAMQREPSRRYRSVEQFSEDLRRWLEGEAVSARPDTFSYRASKYLRRHSFVISAVTTVVIALTAGAWIAWRQAKDAQARFTQVRKLAKRFVFDFHDEIEKLPGSVKARQMLVSTALEYLDNLALSAENDPGLSAELAAAYDRIGDVQGNPLSPNLGQTQEALVSYRKALAIGERLVRNQSAEVDALRTLAQGYLKTGTMYWRQGNVKDAERNLRTALTFADQAKQQFGDPFWLLRVRTYTSLIYCLNYAGEPKRAVLASKEMLQLAQAWVAANPGAEQQYWLAIARSKMGDSLMGVGHFIESEANYRTAMKSLGLLVIQHPGQATYSRDEGNEKGRLARMMAFPGQLNQGRALEAIPLVEAMLKVDETTMLRDPNDIRAKLDHVSSVVIAGLIESEADPVRAAANFARARHIMDSIQVQDAPLFTYQRYTGLMGLGLGTIAERAGRLREAETHYASTCQVQREVLSKHPQAGVLEYPWLISIVRLARVQSALGKKAQAESTLKQGLSDALASLHPQEVAMLTARSDMHEALGALAATAGRTADAQAAFQNSVQLWQSLREDEYGAKRHAQALRLLASVSR